MLATAEHFDPNLMVHPKAFGVAILALLILLTVGLTPMLGSVATHSTAENAISLVVSGTLQETGESSGASTTCVIHIACVAIEVISSTLNLIEFAGAKHPLSLKTSDPRATGPPLLHPPIMS